MSVWISGTGVLNTKNISAHAISQSGTHTNATQFQTTSTTFVNVTNHKVTLTCVAGDVIIMGTHAFCHSSAAGVYKIRFYDGTTQYGGEVFGSNSTWYYSTTASVGTGTAPSSSTDFYVQVKITSGTFSYNMAGAGTGESTLSVVELKR